MKTIYVILILSVVGSFIAGCVQRPDNPCPPDCTTVVDTVPDYPLEIVWESKFYPEDTILVLNFGKHPLAYKNYILYIGREPVNTDKFSVYMFDKTTGEHVHRFEMGRNGIHTITVYNDKLFCTSLDGMFIFDLITFDLEKHIDNKYDHTHTSYKDHIYVTQLFGYEPSVDSSSIIKFNLSTYESEVIYTLKQSDYGDYAAINPVAVDSTEKGVLLYGITETYNRIIFFAYNETTDDFEWRTVIPEVGGDLYYNSPLFDEEKVYITNDHKAVAFDKYTGSIVWESETMEGFYRPYKPVLSDGVLYCKNDLNFYSIDVSNGQIKWHQNYYIGGGPISSVAHDEHYFYTTDARYMRIFEKKTGEVIFKEKSPHANIDLDNLEESKRKYSSFTYAVPIMDFEKGVFYVPDTKRMYCFKIPESW